MLFEALRRKATMVTPDDALEGRPEPLAVDGHHAVLGTNIKPPFPEGYEVLVVGMGCFWGAERLFWKLPGVYTTSVGYAGGFTPNPTYKETCTGRTGHTEVVQVVFDPQQIALDTLLKTFWEGHDPTQRYRQGNDVGTQYRSAIFTTTDAQAMEVQAVAATYGAALEAKGLGEIQTEIAPLTHYYYAETYHQQYLAKNPSGYCGIGGTGVACPTRASAPTA